VPIAAAIVVWELVRRIGQEKSVERTDSGDSGGQAPASSATMKWLRTWLYPFAIPIGFAVGTLTFWLYGVWVDAKVFYIEHLQHHLVGRVTHDAALGYGGYPSIPALWLELWQHTGFLLLPLGIAALGVLCTRKATRPGDGENGTAAAGWRDTFGLWAVWFVLTAVAFSLIDWRQTKHLMPLLLPLCLAPAALAAADRRTLRLVVAALATVLLWNVVALWRLAGDFAAFTITPAW